MVPVGNYAAKACVAGAKNFAIICGWCCATWFVGSAYILAHSRIKLGQPISQCIVGVLIVVVDTNAKSHEWNVLEIYVNLALEVYFSHHH